LKKKKKKAKKKDDKPSDTPASNKKSSASPEGQKAENVGSIKKSPKASLVANPLVAPLSP